MEDFQSVVLDIMELKLQKTPYDHAHLQIVAVLVNQLSFGSIMRFPHKYQGKNA